MKKWIVGACLVAGLIGSGVAVHAVMADSAPAVARDLGEEGGGPFRRFMSGQFGRLLTLRSEMNLTSEQRQQIRTIVQSHRKEIAEVAKPVVEKHRALRDATLAQNIDEKAIRAAAEDLGKSIGDAAVLAAKIKAEVRKVLKPEQIQKIEEFRKHADQATDGFIQQMSTGQ